METFEFDFAAALALGGLLLFPLAWIWTRRYRRAPGAAAAAPRKAPAGRLEALAAAQADLAARLDALAAQAPEERLQAMAGQLVGLIRDKNATMETALAGLDQLRARLRALEQMGEPAEARALLEKLGARLDELAAAQAAGAAALEARLAGLEAPAAAGVAELAERLSKLHEQKDASLATVLARLGPLEAQLAGLAGERAGAAPAREAFARLEARLEALQGAQGAAKAELAVLKAELSGGGPAAALAGQLTRLHEQKEAVAERVLARLAALETEVAARDPEAALAGLAARLAALETPGANPFAEISDQLTRLYAQKDAGVEAVLGRLGPLEARLAELEGGIGRLDPRAALDRFAERLEAVQGRLAALETPGAGPFAEISDQLTRLYAQKDAGGEAVLARLAPLEARLAEIDAELRGRDPQAALAGVEARLEALRDRLAVLEAPGENPFAEISDQLTRLYAQKDAGVEAVLGRLAPLEDRLAELEGGIGRLDPQPALDRFAGRLEALETPGENPFAEISDQLTRLYAQKDAGVEAVLGRLAPLEARLAELEGGIGRLDPQPALDRFAGRLEALETPGENPFAEISDRLTRLYAQKDAGVEAALGRIGPLEARLAELEGGMARLAPLAEDDPRAALDALRARLGELHWAQGEVAAGLAALQAAGDGAAGPLGAIAEQLTRLYAQKDAGIEAVLARLAPLEARLAAIEARPWDPDAEEARAEAQAIAAQLIAARTAAERTELFADRLALLEANLPAPALRAPGRRGEEAGAPAGGMEEIWDLPRLVSLHRR